ncbi:MAG: FAD-dependent oxidoreductase [Desulfobacteraceae bacterium]|nr:MAG: FAD-dependent oxidoreductase [Desulfobacteraceae bacterium]
MKRRRFLKQTRALAGMTLLGSSKSRGQSFGPVLSKRSVLAKPDVLVVGGGPAGIGAALGAARQGVKTLLIENYGFFGGVGAWGLGMQLNQMRPGGRARSAIHELLLEKLKTYGSMAVRLNDHQFLCNVEYLKVAIMDALDAVGCQYLVHMRAVDTLVKGQRVTGVVVTTKSGLREIHARVTIDCTGDADITAFTGAETLKETGNLSPQTLQLNCMNGPLKRRFKGSKSARKKYPLIPPGWGMSQVSNCHFSIINHAGTRDMGNFDITDPHQFSRAECKSRRQVVQMIHAMREFGGEALKDIEICGASPQIGVRESRRVKGLYILTEEDAMQGARFDDVVAWRSGYLDIGFVRLSRMKIHQVPYRALIPEKMDNLLTAGRCISATHEAASAGKSMGNCFATGHAAGVAAALAVKQKQTPRELNVTAIQERLRADRVDLSRGGEEQPKHMPS